MIDIGIVGGAGYTAGELVRLLIHHEHVRINFVYSTSNAGNPISTVHQDLSGRTDLYFSNQINPDVELLFLCLGHGNSKAFLEAHEFSAQTKIIDLSNDFRLKNDSVFRNKTFVYGLPEINRGTIKKADYIANPGCFATGIQLALLPLAAQNLLQEDVHVNAVTGATGAGTSLSKTTHFAWRDNNFSIYKAFTHQHLAEIEQSVRQLQPSFAYEFYFVPNRGNFSRGIFVSAYTKFHGTLEDAQELYSSFYADTKFVFLADRDIHLKQVVNTNHVLIHLHKHKDLIHITCILDNLLKGASGQAVQNMNLMFGWDESMGLKLKANYF